MKTIIHDLTEEDLASLNISENDAFIMHADGKYAFCRGCFKCWLKNAGYCIMNDSLQHIASLIGQSDELTIISRCTYGSFSSQVKTILDRAIGTSLPFFTWRQQQTHHISRYPLKKLMKIYFYGDSTEFEQQTAEEFVQKNSVNLNFDKCETRFFRNVGAMGDFIHGSSFDKRKS